MPLSSKAPLCHQLPKHGDGFLLDSGHLHLTDVHHRRYPLLGQAVEIPQLNDHPLPFRQAGNRLPQSDFLYHPFFRLRVRQNVFQREALVPCFSLDGLRGGSGRFRQSDFFRGEPGLAGDFLNGRFPAQRPGQTAAGGLDGRGLLFQAPGHLDRPVVPEEPANFPGDFRDNVL